MKQIKTILNNNGAGAEKAACTAMSLPEVAMENVCATFEGLGYDRIVGGQGGHGHHDGQQQGNELLHGGIILSYFQGRALD